VLNAADAMPSTTSTLPAVTLAIQRRLRSSPASGPAAERGADRGEVDRVPTGRRADDRADAGHEHRAPPRHRVAQALHHGHARHVLAGHRHDVQRQRDAEDGRERERRCGELDPRHEVGGVDAGARRRDVHRDDGGGGEEGERRRPARQQAQREEPHGHHRRDGCGVVGQAGDRAEAELEQHAGQHRPARRRSGCSR
jgi:hypothetical protein